MMPPTPALGPPPTVAEVHGEPPKKEGEYCYHVGCPDVYCCPCECGVCKRAWWGLGRPTRAMCPEHGLGLVAAKAKAAAEPKATPRERADAASRAESHPLGDQTVGVSPFDPRHDEQGATRALDDAARDEAIARLRPDVETPVGPVSRALYDAQVRLADALIAKQRAGEPTAYFTDPDLAPLVAEVRRLKGQADFLAMAERMGETPAPMASAEPLPERPAHVPNCPQGHANTSRLPDQIAGDVEDCIRCPACPCDYVQVKDRWFAAASPKCPEDRCELAAGHAGEHRCGTSEWSSEGHAFGAVAAVAAALPTDAEDERIVGELMAQATGEPKARANADIARLTRERDEARADMVRLTGENIRLTCDLAATIHQREEAADAARAESAEAVELLRWVVRASLHECDEPNCTRFATRYIPESNDTLVSTCLCDAHAEGHATNAYVLTEDADRLRRVAALLEGGR